MADDRNCTECKHHVPLKPGSDICGCEKWECEFEPKEECTKEGDKYVYHDRVSEKFSKNVG